MDARRTRVALLCGILGCLCFGGGDWLMMYGDPAFSGSLAWLTDGVAGIAQWRYNLAMALAFPGIVLYGIALFSIESFIVSGKQRRVYHFLNAFGLTPWIALHLFYVMILSLFSWMNSNGYGSSALMICENLYGMFSWLVLVSEAIMIPVFVYWFFLQIRGMTSLPRGLAFTNVIFIFVVLKALSLLLPVSAFRLGFTNGLMSESMAIWFLTMLRPARPLSA